MPLPLAMMIPFMGIQSAVMAKQFGENFQYGKRRISAMSNEEFNKLTPVMLQERANAELKAMIPTMEASITDMRDFQKFIVKEFLEMISDLISQGLGNLFGPDIVGALEHFAHGHGGAPPGHQPDWKPGTLPPPPGSTPIPPSPPAHVHTPGEHGHPIDLDLHHHDQFHEHPGEKQAPRYATGSVSDQKKNWTGVPQGKNWWNKDEWTLNITIMYAKKAEVSGEVHEVAKWDARIIESISWGFSHGWYYTA